MHASIWPSGLLQEWRQGLANQPLRAWGLRMLDLGVLWLFASAALPQQVKHVGLALVLVGGLLARPPINRLPGFWCAATAATLVVASTWWHTLDESAGALSRNWLVAWLAAVVLVDPGQRRWALRLGMAGAALAIALSLAQTLVGATVDVRHWHLAQWGARFTRVGGFLHPVPAANMWVGVFFWLLPPAVYLGMRQARLQEWRFLLVAVIVISQIRMALLALLLALGLWWTLRGRRMWFLALLPLAVLAATGLLALVDPERFERMLRFEDGRWPIWRIGWQIIREHPWWGVGPGSGLSEAYRSHLTGETVSEFGTRYFNLHNTALTIAAQHGLLTLGLFLAAAARLLYVVWRRSLLAGHLTACCLLAVAVLGSFDHLLGRTDYHMALWLALGLFLALADQPEETVAGPGLIPAKLHARPQQGVQL